nr:PREDICTED: UDP-glucose:glycoprotein glucosyltransferase 2-like [Lepisosteus oculatus]
MAAASQTERAMMRVLSFLLVIILNAHCGHAASKGVNVILSAKWPATPLLLETSEFIAEDGEEKFWQFVDTSLYVLITT